MKSEDPDWAMPQALITGVLALLFRKAIKVLSVSVESLKVIFSPVLVYLIVSGDTGSVTSQIWTPSTELLIVNSVTIPVPD